MARGSSALVNRRVGRPRYRYNANMTRGQKKGREEKNITRGQKKGREEKKRNINGRIKHSEDIIPYQMTRTKEEEREKRRKKWEE